MGRLAYAAMPRQRLLVLNQLGRVFRDGHPAGRRRLARDVFVQLGRNLVDVGRLSRMKAQDLCAAVAPPRAASLDRFLRPGRGAVVVTAHYGAWELLPSILAVSGRAVWILVNPLREPRLDALLSRIRSSFGVRLVRSTEPVGACLCALRSGGVLMMAADQERRGRRIPGRFLGQPAWLAAGPATLAVLAGAPLIPMGIRLGQDGRHSVLSAPPVVRPAGLTREAAVAALTQGFTDVLERWILEDPSQWAWFHERWKTPPD